jgi:hypothetical protein
MTASGKHKMALISVIRVGGTFSSEVVLGVLAAKLFSIELRLSFDHMNEVEVEAKTKMKMKTKAAVTTTMKPKHRFSASSGEASLTLFV